MQRHGASPRWNWGQDDYNLTATDNIRVDIRRLAEGRGARFRVGHTPEAQRIIARWPREPDQHDWDQPELAPHRASRPGVPGFGVLQPMWKKLVRDRERDREKLSDDTLAIRASARRFVASSPITDGINNLVTTLMTNSVTNRITNRDRAQAVAEAESDLRWHRNESFRRPRNTLRPFSERPSQRTVARSVNPNRNRREPFLPFNIS